MSNVGPVCHIPPASTPGNPQPKNIPGIPGPVAPGDANGTANLVNAMRLALLSLLNQLGSIGNNTTIINNGGASSPKQSKSQWTEQSRVTDKVKIYQNNDKNSSNFVEVEQVNQLIMRDNNGNTWTWSRGSG
jgi:hypothetical protein